MKLFEKPDKLPPALRGGALTIGNFDGVHRGHQRLIECLTTQARQLGRAAVVLTFNPHPAQILRPEQAPPPLTWIERKADLLAQLGVDAVIAYPTDREFLALPPDAFFQKIVIDQVGAQAMVEGPNFFFGHQREGDVHRLAQLTTSHAIDLTIVESVLQNGQVISSSRIRDLIRQGEVEKAGRLLTQLYRIRGVVAHGAARGQTIGFPTANLGAIDTLIPAPGVYAGRTHVGNSAYWSAVHIGPNPTFGEDRLKVESHLIDFEGTLYGDRIEVEFVRRLRDIRHFDSRDRLTQQLQRDVNQTKKIAREHEGSAQRPATG